MADAQIEVVGLRELVKDIKAAGDKQLEDELKDAHKASAEVVAVAARPMIPRQSGLLAGTLRTAASLRGGRVALGKKKVPYANPIHWGWPSRGIEARPFLLDAFQANQPQALEAFETRVERLVDHIGP